MAPNVLIISTRNLVGDYEEVWRLYPRVVPVPEMIDLSEFFIGDRLGVRLEWTQQIHLNTLPFRFFQPLDVYPVETELISCEHSQRGNLKGELTSVERWLRKVGQYVKVDTVYLKEYPNYEKTS